jgi:regulator of RNase E activity RraB
MKKNELAVKMYNVLMKIAKWYQTPDQLRKNCKKEYGLGFEESLEMAYENLQAEAKAAIKGVRIASLTKPETASKRKISQKQIEEWKRKAEKWDALDDDISKYYCNKDGEVDEDNPEKNGDLGDIGEVAARALGWL